jgi:hypothetical protein
MNCLEFELLIVDVLSFGRLDQTGSNVVEIPIEFELNL